MYAESRQGQEVNKDLSTRYQEDGKNCIMMRFIIYIVHKLLFGCQVKDHEMGRSGGTQWENKVHSGSRC
jgi:hypothetical protein